MQLQHLFYHILVIISEEWIFFYDMLRMPTPMYTVFIERYVNHILNIVFRQGLVHFVVIFKERLRFNYTLTLLIDFIFTDLAERLKLYLLL